MTCEAFVARLRATFPKIHRRQAYEESAKTCWATERGESEGRCHQDEYPDHWYHDQRAEKEIGVVTDLLWPVVEAAQWVITSDMGDRSRRDQLRRALAALDKGTG